MTFPIPFLPAHLVKQEQAHQRMKRVIPATGGAYSDISIQPGTTPRDVKKQLGLAENFVLTRGRGTEPIPDDENLYESVSDGSKLYATTNVEWGK